MNVALADRREPEGPMAIGVLLRTDPERRSIEQAHGGGHDASFGAPSSPRSRTIVSRRTGSARANDSTRRNFVTSCRTRQLGWYRYCRRPAASTPTACRCPCGSAQIHTSVHAGGSRVLGCAHRPPHRARGAPIVLVGEPRPAAAPGETRRRRVDSMQSWHAKNSPTSPSDETLAGEPTSGARRPPELLEGLRQDA